MSPKPEKSFFEKATIEIDEDREIVRVIVPLSYGKSVLEEIPIAVACAWLIDNAAGKLLAEAAKYKP